MLAIDFIRDNTEKVKKACLVKKSPVDIDRILELDLQRRELIGKIQVLREQRNELGGASTSRDARPSEEHIQQGKKIKEDIKVLEDELNGVEKELDDLMIMVPNIPHDDVPEGKDESENVVIRSWGTPNKFDFEPKDHMSLGEALDIIDTKTAAKVTGTRFNYLKGKLAMLEYALVLYVFQTLQNTELLKELAGKIDPALSSKPFMPIVPPVMIRPEVYRNMARLDPEQEDERYYFQKDDLYLIGSAEHTMGPLHMDEILNEKDLPVRYVGFSTAFRRESGSYGKDVKGILRVHQFDKIELESFSLPENSVKEQDFIVAIQEYLLQSLNLPYQVIMICTGDMGGPDARQIDINTWMPGQNLFRETHTSDLMTDYQARRLNTKVRRADGSTEFVHMNDATAFAIGRILIAIIENYQQADGSIKVPLVLQPLAGFDSIS